RDLLDEARDREDGDDEIGALLRRARRRYDRAVRIPAALGDEISSHTAASFVAWSHARPANDFESVRPSLERTLALSRRVAECYPAQDHIADPLVDEQDPGMTDDLVRRLFSRLREGLTPLLAQIEAHPAPE